METDERGQFAFVGVIKKKAFESRKLHNMFKVVMQLGQSGINTTF